MDTSYIIELALHILAAVGYVVLAILAIKRKKTVVKADDNSKTNAIEDVLTVVTTAIPEIEEMYSKLFKEGAKSGAFKLRDVLDIAKNKCEELSISFDKPYWTNTINNIVNAINLISKKNENEVQTTGQEKTEQENTTFKYIGGNE